jgi:hypothetical protein
MALFTAIFPRFATWFEVSRFRRGRRDVDHAAWLRALQYTGATFLVGELATVLDTTNAGDLALINFGVGVPEPDNVAARRVA